MGSSERLHLRWNDFESNIKLGFSELRNDEDFFDVTLACGSKQIKAHKVILSACSPFFRSLIKSLSHSHPLLYLRNVKSSHLESLLCFMYNGEVSVSQDELNDFLAIAEEFQIKGLSQNNSPSSNEAPPPSKRPRLPPPNKPKQPSSSKPPMTFTILDDGEVKEETTPKEEEENKFIPPNNEAAATNDESREYDQDFSDETMFESEEFIQESDYSNDNLEPELSGMPGSSGGLAQPNENKEQIWKSPLAFPLQLPKEEKCLSSAKASLMSSMKSEEPAKRRRCVINSNCKANKTYVSCKGCKRPMCGRCTVMVESFCHECAL